MQVLKKTITMTGAIALLTGSFLSAAFAEGTDTNAGDKSAKSDQGSKMHLMEDSEEVRAVQTVKTSLQDAIGSALKAVPGKALEAEFEDEDNKYAYEVKIVQKDGKVVKVYVDAEDGKVIKQK